MLDPATHNGFIISPGQYKLPGAGHYFAAEGVTPSHITPWGQIADTGEHLGKGEVARVSLLIVKSNLHRHSV